MFLFNPKLLTFCVLCALSLSHSFINRQTIQTTFSSQRLEKSLSPQRINKLECLKYLFWCCARSWTSCSGGDGSWKSEPFQPTICLWVKLVATKENMSPCGDRAFIDCIYRTLLYCSIAVGIFSQYVDA